VRTVNHGRVQQRAGSGGGRAHVAAANNAARYENSGRMAMRGVFCLAALMAAAWSGAMAQTIPQQCQTKTPYVLKYPCIKFIKITNNSNKMLYPIVFSGAREADDWLRSLFGLDAQQIKKDKFATEYTYRSYVIEDEGMAPNTTVYVQVPFYSALVTNPDPTQKDQYVDWWNGGRVFLYDDAKQVRDDYKAPNQKLVTPATPGLAWCTSLNKAETACVAPHALNLFKAREGFPPTDLSQLTEYTFADAVTADGAPFPLFLNKVGYNISSVDQAYLPVAMEPLGNPTIPYIGTVVGLPKFRAKLRQFLADFPGWPVYEPYDENRPRIPGAYNVYASKVDLTKPGETIDQMDALYRKCIDDKEQSQVCTQYQAAFALLEANYAAFEKLDCHDPAIKFDEAQVIKRIYGWVSFNEGCGAGANSLRSTVGDKKLAVLEHGYITNMQYSKTEPLYNPYVSLIHDPKYLDMAAYAFSIDDAIGFQSYVGTGLILAYAGSGGLDNDTKLDLRDRVTVTLGAPGKGQAKWGAFGLCSNTANYGEFQNNFWALDFFPSKYPCRFTAAQTDGTLFQFVIRTAPQSPSGLTVACPANVSDPAWCAQAQVVGPQAVNAPPPTP
jgi:hypothetical protein